MSEWITDRMPTKDEVDRCGMVWVTMNQKVVGVLADDLMLGQPWMTRCLPEPYKPSRREWTINVSPTGELDNRFPRADSMRVKVREVFESDPDPDAIPRVIERLEVYANGEFNIPWGEAQEIIDLLTGKVKQL